MLIDLAGSAAIACAFAGGWALWRPFYPFLRRDRTALAVVAALLVLDGLPAKTSDGRQLLPGAAPWPPAPPAMAEGVRPGGPAPAIVIDQGPVQASHLKVVRPLPRPRRS